MANVFRHLLIEVKLQLVIQPCRFDAAPKQLWPGDLDAEPTAWLAGEGWRATAADPTELAEGYGRPVPRLLDPAEGGAPYSVFVSAELSLQR